MSPLPLLLTFLLLPASVQQNPDWEEVRHIAESQHEILLLLIEKKDFERIPKVAGEIFRLPFPPDQEHLVVKEIEILTDALLHHNQLALAHRILDDALRCVKTTRSRAQIHREKAYVFKKEGKTDEAMAEFEKSVALEKEDEP
jgi:hypothetical protein